MLTVAVRPHCVVVSPTTDTTSHKNVTRRTSHSINKYKQLSYRKQTARQLRTQHIEGIYSNSVTLKSELEVTHGH